MGAVYVAAAAAVLPADVGAPDELPVAGPGGECEAAALPATEKETLAAGVQTCGAMSPVCPHYEVKYDERRCPVCGDRLLVCPKCLGPGPVVCEYCERILKGAAVWIERIEQKQTKETKSHERK